MSLTIRKRYMWGRRHDGRVELYAESHRTLQDISKHPRPLRQMGLPRATERAIRAEVPSLRHRARLEQRHRCGGARPVLLMITATGQITDIWLASDTWRELASGNTEVE